ncbi:hypothetical protein IWW50_001348 [Coemansia erecta]|nr:hypothetical protein GGF43_001998 [Coemansia sp. RSA 2618]KAJ2828516.1 hypothetical protein IWW50_001348 [Coemansia erecta]
MDESNADVAESTDFLSSSRQSSDSNNMSDSTVDKSANVSADEAKNSSRSGLSSGAIAGIAVGVSLFVIIVLALAIRWLVLAHKKRSAEKYWDREMNKMQSVRSLGQPGQGDQE